VLAVDVGGTKLAAGLVDPDGRVLRASRRPTPATGDGEEVWAALGELVDAVVGSEPVPAVGVGCGGPMRWPAGEVSPLNIPGWRAFPLRARLSERFPGAPVRLHNDAVCLAVAEHWRGAARGHDDALGMVVSTGVGGGLVLGGRLVDGASGNAGHVGHVVVDPNGPDCSCGGRGCLEAIASGPRTAQWAAAQGWRGGTTAQELAAAARAGARVAVAAFARAGAAVGVAIASVAALCDVSVAVVGGGVVQAGPLVLGPLRDAVREHAVMDFTRHLPVVPAALGQEAGLVGAAALVLAGDRYWRPDGLAT
jgi:glucokinase